MWSSPGCVSVCKARGTQGREEQDLAEPSSVFLAFPRGKKGTLGQELECLACAEGVSSYGDRYS